MCTMLHAPTYIHTNFKGKEKEGMEGGKKEREGEMKERKAYARDKIRSK